MTNEIIVICGFSSSGKDTIANKLKEQGYNFVISTSTRPIRENESEGNPYYFIDNVKFEEMISNDEFIEYRKYTTIQNGKDAVWYYGVNKVEISPNKKYVVVLDPEGTMSFKKELEDRVIVFYIDVDDDERRRRAELRCDFELAEYERRYQDDKIRFTEDVINKITNFKIKNYNLDDCVYKIINVINNLKQNIHVAEMEVV